MARDQKAVAGIYVRVSSQKQKDQGSSLETQLQRCRDYAFMREYAVAEDYVIAEVMSGALYYERDGLQRLLRAVKARKINVVVFYTIDRLSREELHARMFVDEVTRHGCTIEFVDDAWDDTPEGRLMFSIKAYAAMREREKIKERSERGLNDRVFVHNLPRVGASAPYGTRWVYGNNPRKGEQTQVAFEADPSTFGIVREIFDSLLVGKSIRSIAFELTAKGIPTPKGKSVWTGSIVYYILTNPIYSGTLIANRYAKVHEKKVIENGWRGKPCVTPAEWEQVQQVLKENREMSSRRLPRPEIFLIRGMVFCGACGSAMGIGRNHLNGREPSHGYRCSRGERDARTCPGAPNIRTYIADDIVWQQILPIITNPSIIRREVERMRAGVGDVTEEIADAGKKLDAIKAQMRKLQQTILASDDPDWNAMAQEQLSYILQQKSHWEERKRIAGEQQHSILLENTEIDMIESYIEQVRSKLTTSFTAKRMILRLLGVRVYINAVNTGKPRLSITANIKIGGDNALIDCLCDTDMCCGGGVDGTLPDDHEGRAESGRLTGLGGSFVFRTTSSPEHKARPRERVITFRWEIAIPTGHPSEDTTTQLATSVSERVSQT